MIRFEMIEGVIPLHIFNNKVIIWSNGRLQRKDSICTASCNILHKIKGLIRRVNRTGPNFLIKIDSGYIYHYNKYFQVLDNNLNPIKKVLSDAKGSRPLNVAKYGDGIIFGEYFSNPGREKVRIINITSEGEVRNLYTFDNGTIRHVHNCIYDRFNSSWIILTGDLDDESSLCALDEKLNMQKILHGSQRFRAVSVILLKDYIILPTDTPLEENFIQAIDRRTGDVRILNKMIGSAFHTYHDEDLMLISTVTEPSLINKTKEAAIYASLDGLKWIDLLRFKKDFFSVSFQKITRYSEIRFLNKPFKGSIICEGRALKGLSHGILILNKEDIINELKRTSA